MSLITTIPSHLGKKNKSYLLFIHFPHFNLGSLFILSSSQGFPLRYTAKQAGTVDEWLLIVVQGVATVAKRRTQITQMFFLYKPSSIGLFKQNRVRIEHAERVHNVGVSAFEVVEDDA